MNNIFVRFPKIGDVVVKDFKTKTPHYISLSSFVKEELNETEYEIIGAVAWRWGDKVLVVYKNNASNQFMNRAWWYLDGYTLDGTDRTGTISIRAESNNYATNIDKVISYNATTVEDFITQLNKAFAEDTDFDAQDWFVNLEDGKVRVHCDIHTWQQIIYNSFKSGFRGSKAAPEIDYDSNIRRKNGSDSDYGAISSMPRALSMFGNDNQSATYNPTSDVTSVAVQKPICLPAYLGTSKYQSDHCKLLREVYGEGRDGWERFMRSMIPVVPCDYGIMRKRDGKRRTDLMNSFRYTSRKVSTPTAMCGAASYCHEISSDAIAKGEFWLPTVEELYYILQTIEYGTNPSRDADPINECLRKIGGTAISNGAFIVSCCRYDGDNACVSNGEWGYFGYRAFTTTYRSVPVSLYTV